MKNRILSIITCLTLCLCLLPVLTQTASATVGVSYVEYSWNEATSTLSSETKAVTEYTAVTAETTTWEDGRWYVVKDNVTINSRVTVNGSANLILADGCSLSTNGITVEPGNTLTIYGQSQGAGRLSSVATDNFCAGIGGGKVGGACGTVVIHGGVVMAQGGPYTAAGIGGAGAGAAYDSRKPAGNGGDVTIYNGTVTAVGTYYSMADSSGAGIGGGGGHGLYQNRAGNGGTVKIYGGVVTATSSRNIGSGIGGGGCTRVNNQGTTFGGDGGTVTIAGGVVTVAGCSDGIGRGEGSNRDGSFTASNCIVYENGTNKIYPAPHSGTCTLTGDYTIPEGMHLNIKDGEILTIPGGVTLTNNGTLTIHSAACLRGEGTLNGNGVFARAVNINDISVPSGLTYNGTEQPLTVTYPTDSITVLGRTFYPFGTPTPTTSITFDRQTVTTARNAGTYTVTVGSESNYLTKTFRVNKASIMDFVPAVPAEGLVYNGTEQELFVSPASGRVHEGDTLSITYNFTTAKDANDRHRVEYILDAGSNYYAISRSNFVRIAKKPVELEWTTLTAEELVYDGTDKILTATAVGIVEGDTCDVTVNYLADICNVGTFVCYASHLSNSNYQLPEARQSPEYTITPAPVTVTADSHSIYVGNELPELTYVVEGLIGSDTLTSEPVLATDTDGKTAGTYTITVSGAAASDNYSITYVDGTLTVSYPPSSPTYTPTVDDSNGGDTTVSNKNPEKGDKVTITTEPDKGYVVGKITITDKNGKPVEVIDNGNGTFTYVQPSGKVTIEVEYVPAGSCFMDVAEESYYYDAVNWAAANGITSGTSATTFSPNNPCTRAQMATFLWHAAGAPEPKGNSNPFTDVTADAYYAKAVQWAVEQGITAGTSATTFSPNGACTRAQMATFIYRCEQANGGGFAGAWMFLLPFTDAPEWAYEPIAWCYKEGITSGTSATTFGPDDPCTRAQMVTFLYRYFVK